MQSSASVTVDQEEEGHLDRLLLLVEMTLILALILHSDRGQSEYPGVQGLKVDRNTGGSNKHLEQTTLAFLIFCPQCPQCPHSYINGPRVYLRDQNTEDFTPRD